MGMGTLRIAPSEFWKLTFAELYFIFRSQFPEAEQPITQNDYEEMKAAFNKKVEEKNGRR